MPYKNPRLFAPLSSEEGHNAMEQSEGALAYDSTGQQNLSHVSPNGTDASWPHLPGSSVGLQHTQNSLHWHGTYPDGSFQAGTNDYVPEIENFLADFDRSEFTWSFPVAGVGDSCEANNFQIEAMDYKNIGQYDSK